jgi:transposase
MVKFARKGNLGGMQKSEPKTHDCDPLELFESIAPTQALALKIEVGAVRLRRPNRKQLELRAQDLESLLGEGHRARLVWGYVERQELSSLHAKIRARDGTVGRHAVDPRVLFALWLYATLEGVGSARELARLTREHDAYRWICGGIELSYRTLAKWRVQHDEALDELLTDNLATLASVGVIKLARVAQDGMRVRASAGAASFRREARLNEYLEQARARVAELKGQTDLDPGAAQRKAQAAKLRLAQEREQRIGQALARLPEMAAVKLRNGQKAEDARASSTDADASNMKMADGGFRPAYNVQFASDCEAQVIVGVEVVTAGSDMAQLAPMVEQVERRLGRAPGQWLVDGGFPAHAQIDAVQHKTEVYAPVPEAKKKNTPKKGKTDKDAGDKDEQGDPGTQDAAVDKHAAKPGDSAAVAQWRQRMGSDEAKRIYKERAATAECVNAQARQRGLNQMPVRGLARVKCVARLYVLAHNLMRTAVLAPHLIGWGMGASAAAKTA